MNVNECRIEELETQLNELKANNARLREVARMVGLQDGYIDYGFRDKVLNETPAQSLAAIQHDAVMDVISLALENSASWIADSDEVGAFIENVNDEAKSLI